MKIQAYCPLILTKELSGYYRDKNYLYWYKNMDGNYNLSYSQNVWTCEECRKLKPHAIHPKAYKMFTDIIVDRKYVKIEE